MKHAAIQAKTRQNGIAKLLLSSKNASTAQLAKKFGVTTMTIRRDLKAMEASGDVLPCYGGAVAAQRITFEFAFDQRKNVNLKEKQRIAHAAVQMIKPNETLFLDTGTTTLQVARVLAQTDLPCSVITSSLVIASELWGLAHIDLQLLGGRVRQNNPDLVGPNSELLLDKLTADLAFLGSDGLEPTRGSFAPDPETARLAEKMTAHALKAIVVADHTKIGHPGRVRYAKINEIHELITDKKTPTPQIKILRKQGLKITLA